MWKMIIKNLWNRRQRNVWLLAELILVSVVTWVILDPVIVLLHDNTLPLGYDADRLCLVEIAGLDNNSSKYDATATDSVSISRDYFRLLERTKEWPEVEEVAPILSFTYINSLGNSSTRWEVDSVSFSSNLMFFTPGHNYLKTYGLKAAPGSPSIEDLDKGDFGKSDLILTETLARRLFPDGQAVGKELPYMDYSIMDTVYSRVRGVVQDVRHYSYWRPTPIAFVPQPRITIFPPVYLLVRLRPGVSMSHFLEEFRPWTVKELRSGNLFARSVISYSKLLADKEYREGVSNEIHMNIALALFFLMNLCLGVIGAFWLQTQKRKEEAGIMRSFGATPGFILRVFWGEGFVLTTVSFVIGCFAYLQYALSEGIYVGRTPDYLMSSSYWVSSFSTHFIGVSVVVYLVILAVVLIGIYIPARNISHIPPTEALRDE